MNERKAIEILGDSITDNGLEALDDYLTWSNQSSGDVVVLDGSFTAIELEAIAWWVNNKSIGAMRHNAPET